MAVDVNQVAGALRLTDGVAAPEAAQAAILARLLSAAGEIVGHYAPEAPTVIKDEAVIRLCGYWYDQPTAGRGQGWANAWTNSGAASLCMPWVVLRLGTEAGP